MKYYAGLDVSLKETFLSVIDEKGNIIFEDKVVTDIQDISKTLRNLKIDYENIGIESGQLSIFLCKGLKQEGFPIVCMDARHTAAALSARSNKNDKNDARGIARLLQTGWHKEVEIKTAQACEKKILLGSRDQLVICRQKIMGTIRGLLKMYGVVLGTQKDFAQKVQKHIQGLNTYEKAGIQELLNSLEGTVKLTRFVKISCLQGRINPKAIFSKIDIFHLT